MDANCQRNAPELTARPIQLSAWLLGYSARIPAIGLPPPTDTTLPSARVARQGGPKAK
jgi:hypothetical protein